MYLHLSPDMMIPIKDIVAIIPYPKQKGAAILQSFDLPVRAVGVSSERNWRSLVITGETMLRRYQKCLQMLSHCEKA